MTMLFGLKNIGATYQQAIQQCLKDQIRDQLIEGYVDDVVVKTKVASTLVGDLDQTFKALNKFQWKLNFQEVHIWRVIWHTAWQHS
jgi:hypothetical protein